MNIYPKIEIKEEDYPFKMILYAKAKRGKSDLKCFFSPTIILDNCTNNGDFNLIYSAVKGLDNAHWEI